MEENSLTRNSLMLIAMANEYCHEIEHALEHERGDFVYKMLKLLPRIYISISDVTEKEDEAELYNIESYLQEDVYNSVRERIYQLLGEDDTYLEVFEDDMKYSDTPIATTISENLSDLYQEFYNLIVSVQNAPAEAVNELMNSLKSDFKIYWGQTLVNVMRALHNVKYNDEMCD